MRDGKYAYLVCVDGEKNANKYYEMKQIDGSTFEASYGREGKTRTTHVYDMWDWDRVYQSKVRYSKKPRPYTDVTHLKRVEVVDVSDSADTDIAGVKDSRIQQLLTRLQSFARGSIARNYKVSSNEVTARMLDEAQSFLDQIAGLVYTPATAATNRDINELLEYLYQAVPREMRKVQEHLLPFTNDLDVIGAKRLFNLEQANIDVMYQQAKSTSPVQVASAGPSMLDTLGLTMRVADPKEALRIKYMIKSQENKDRIGTVYVIENLVSQKAFDARLKAGKLLGSNRGRTQFYWHGSRNENWLSILQRGLLIRPPGIDTTGDMFGLGIYFADKFQKSFGYTSARGSYHASGRSDTGYMAVFDVLIGNQYEVGRHRSDCYNLTAAKLDRMGYDSVWGQTGYSLRNNEYIVYSPNQCTVAYLIQLR